MPYRRKHRESRFPAILALFRPFFLYFEFEGFYNSVIHQDNDDDMPKGVYKHLYRSYLHFVLQRPYASHRMTTFQMECAWANIKQKFDGKNYGTYSPEEMAYELRFESLKWRVLLFNKPSLLGRLFYG